jgi:hypothetical protein
MATRKKGISTSPSKKRKPIRLNTSAAKKRRLEYQKRMRNPTYRAKMQKYRKKYYQKNKAKLLKKAKATYKSRKAEILKRRKQLRNLRAKHGIKGNISKFFTKAKKALTKKAAPKKAAAKKATKKSSS